MDQINIIHQRYTTRMTGLFSTATHISNDDTTPLVNQGDIIIPNINLPNKVHNEDFHYSRLMVGFVYNNDNSSLPISIYDPNFEPLLFLHLFSNSKSHYHNMKKYT